MTKEEEEHLRYELKVVYNQNKHYRKVSEEYKTKLRNIKYHLEQLFDFAKQED